MWYVCACVGAVGQWSPGVWPDLPALSFMSYSSHSLCQVTYLKPPVQSPETGRVSVSGSPQGHVVPFMCQGKQHHVLEDPGSQEEAMPELSFEDEKMTLAGGRYH